jgi:hypothetical protein
MTDDLWRNRLALRAQSDRQTHLWRFEVEIARHTSGRYAAAVCPEDGKTSLVIPVCERERLFEAVRRALSEMVPD